MRLFLAGIIILSLASAATAQVKALVESVGVGGIVRPDGWNPVIVTLKSTVSEPRQYQIQVWQEDLDKDRVVYTKDVSLGSGAQQRYELYFVLTPHLLDEERGLALSSADLKRLLHVRICEGPGENKRPDELKVVLDRATVDVGAADIDPGESRDGGALGKRLVLCVIDASGSCKPAFSEYDKSVGMTEEIAVIPVRPSELGESPLYYDGVDAVIWFNGKADDLSAGGSHRLDAIEQYLRAGGRLIICQPTELSRIEALADLSPVQTKDENGKWSISIEDKATFADDAADDATSTKLDPLPALSLLMPRTRYHPQWSRFNPDGKNPLKIARAKAKADSVVELWQYWSATDRSPYLVRRPYGLGCVTWVAQDLGDTNLSTNPNAANWVHIWDRVIGWQNDLYTRADAASGDREKEEHRRENQHNYVDLSRWMLQGTDFSSKGAEYVGLAIVFFLLYWLAAGPGAYFLLRQKNKKELNWFVFGFASLAATLVTLLLVRVLLRGGAEARHLSVVRQVIGEPAIVHSRVGLYIPRDGEQKISLAAGGNAVSYVTPLQVHPNYVSPTNFPASQVYGIPVHDDPQSVSLTIPFRSTVKKLELQWAGENKNAVAGSARLIGDSGKDGVGDKGVIDGRLVNETGADLRNIYFVFNYSKPDARAEDRVLWLGHWPKDKAVDLNELYAGARLVNDESSDSFGNPRISRDVNIKGPIDRWSRLYWSPSWKDPSDLTEAGNRAERDYTEQWNNGFVTMSLFDRIPPARNEAQRHRVDFIRRGGRVLNMSSAVAAGKLVVLAQSNDDEQGLPAPLQANGSGVEGRGRVLYQFAIPLDRTIMQRSLDEKKGSR